MDANDREDIRELTALYARAIDTRDYPAIAECFAPDAVAQYGGFSAELHGRDEIVAHMRKALEPLDVTQHLFTNFIIAGDGAAARLECDILAQHITGSGADRDNYLAGGHYTVEVEKSGGRWRFTRLDARSSWGMGSRDLLPRSA